MGRKVVLQFSILGHRVHRRCSKGNSSEKVVKKEGGSPHMNMRSFWSEIKEITLDREHWAQCKGSTTSTRRSMMWRRDRQSNPVVRNVLSFVGLRHVGRAVPADVKCSSLPQHLEPKNACAHSDGSCAYARAKAVYWARRQNKGRGVLLNVDLGQPSSRTSAQNAGAQRETQGFQSLPHATTCDVNSAGPRKQRVVTKGVSFCTIAERARMAWRRCLAAPQDPHVNAFAVPDWGRT